MSAKSAEIAALYEEYVRQRKVLQERAALVRRTEGGGERLELLKAAIRNLMYSENALSRYV